MRARAIAFVLSVLLAGVAFGQDVSQVFYFTYTQSPGDMQQITDTIRTIGEITHASLNAGSKALTVSGTPAQLAMAAWVVTAMDQPAPANHATQEYRPEGSVNDVVRIFYLTHSGTPVRFQEIVDTVRTIPEMTRLSPYYTQNAIVLRGTDRQVAMAEWLFHQSDVPAGVQPAQDPAAHRYVTPGAANDEVRVLFLSHPWDWQSMQDIASAVRTVPQLTKVFSCQATGAVAMRGAPATLELATWLFNQLNQAPPKTAGSPQEFRTPGRADDVTQVSYLGAAATAENLQSLIEAIPPAANQRAFANPALNALILRGRAAQIAAADRLIANFEQNQLAVPTASQVFHFTYAQAPSDIQQITDAIRTVGAINRASLNTDAKSLTVNGTPAQLAMAAWIFTAMDQPSPANRATQEFRPAGSANDVVRMLYLTQPRTPQSFQEIVNAMRTIPEITKVYPYTPQNAVLMRAKDNQAAMSEWLFHQLDLPAGMQPVQDPAAHQYESPVMTVHNENDEVRVLFLSHAWSTPGMQEIVNAVRTIPQLTKVFPCVAIGGVAVRGLPATLDLAAWLFHQLDQVPPTAAAAPQEYRMPGGADDVTQVFYLGASTAVENLPSIVKTVRPAVNNHAFPDAALNALVLRGTATQIAAADALIKQTNQP